MSRDITKKSSGRLRILLPLLMLGLSSPAFALTFRIGTSVNYYIATDSLLKELYGRGSFFAGGFLSLDITRNFEIRSEFNSIYLKGHMLLSEEDIALTMSPLVLAVRFRLNFGKVSPYIGTGINFIPYKEEYPARIGDFSDSKAGIQLEAGNYLFLGPRFFVDLNLRYVFADVVQLLGDTIKLGGIRAGLSVGYAF